MSPLAQAIVVGMVVAVATLHAAWRFIPGAMRARLAAMVARWGAWCGLSAVDARRVEQKLATRGACGSCDDCGACGKTSDAAPAAREWQPVAILRADERLGAR